MAGPLHVTTREWLRLHGCETVEEYEALPRYPLAQFCRRCDTLKKSVEAECDWCLAHPPESGAKKAR